MGQVQVVVLDGGLGEFLLGHEVHADVAVPHLHQPRDPAATVTATPMADSTTPSVSAQQDDRRAAHVAGRALPAEHALGQMAAWRRVICIRHRVGPSCRTVN